MEYQVPQFIEVEDKIIGPLTLKQFIYLAGEAGFSYYTRAKLFLWKHKDAAVTEKSAAVAAAIATAPQNTPKLTRGKLSELAWSLDVKLAGNEAEHLQS